MCVRFSSAQQMLIVQNSWIPVIWELSSPRDVSCKVVLSWKGKIKHHNTEKNTIKMKEKLRSIGSTMLHIFRVQPSVEAATVTVRPGHLIVPVYTRDGNWVTAWSIFSVSMLWIVWVKDSATSNFLCGGSSHMQVRQKSMHGRCL